MPNRNQSQDQGQRNQKGRNPGTLPPDNDEAQVEGQDPTFADARGNRRTQQQDTGPVSNVEDEEAEDDEDDADGIGARP